jgi:hypothetical protein
MSAAAFHEATEKRAKAVVFVGRGMMEFVQADEAAIECLYACSCEGEA